jgi:N-acyl-D-aspartate/D-glutamate deacylase
VIGSDGGIQFETRANSHPRGAACFATAIRHALEIKLPLETILEKMTSLPCSVIQPAMKERGILENGAFADVVVFDPVTIRGNATVEDPNQFSSGIELVIVNGKVAFKDGKLEGKNGKAIRADTISG